MSQELAVIDLTYELGVWLDVQIERFPKAARFVVGSRILNKQSELLDTLLEAKFSRDKSAALKQAALLLEQIRFQLRLCHDRRYLSHGCHQLAIEKLTQISRQVQGWRKFCDRDGSP
jgi:hypothetical protein